MKLSVIVPTYNRPEALKKVLDGLFHQSCPPGEILVADDGSGPDTRGMLEKAKRQSPVPLTHVWQTDKGFRLARIRNKAILAATGEYLVLLDGDCIPGKHFVADHMALARPGYFFQGKRVLVNRKVESGFNERDTDSFFRLFFLACTAGISNFHHIVRLSFLPSYTTTKLTGVRGCNMAFFKEDLLAVNGYNENFSGWGREDQEIVARLYKYGVKRREHPFRAICFHLWHPENPRNSLEQNDLLLEQTLASDTWSCRQGLSQAAHDDCNR